MRTHLPALKLTDTLHLKMEWVFPEIRVPPNHPLNNRVFHHFHHPILVVKSPYFWFNTRNGLEDGSLPDLPIARPDAAVDVAFFSPHKLLGTRGGLVGVFLVGKLCKAGFLVVVGFFVNMPKKRHPQMFFVWEGWFFHFFPETN